MQPFYILIVVEFTQHYILIRFIRLVLNKLIFIVWKLYLNKSKK